MRPKGSRLSSKPGARARAWQSMRILRRFTQAELQMTAEIRRTNVKRFVARLLAAGYIRVIRERVNGIAGQGNIYQLVRDTGPLAPIPWKNGEMLDQNTRQIFGPGGVEVVPTGERPT